MDNTTTVSAGGALAGMTPGQAHVDTTAAGIDGEESQGEPHGGVEGENKPDATPKHKADLGRGLISIFFGDGYIDRVVRGGYGLSWVADRIDFAQQFAAYPISLHVHDLGKHKIDAVRKVLFDDAGLREITQAAHSVSYWIGGMPNWKLDAHVRREHADADKWGDLLRYGNVLIWPRKEIIDMIFRIIAHGVQPIVDSGVSALRLACTCSHRQEEDGIIDLFSWVIAHESARWLIAQCDLNGVTLGMESIGTESSELDRSAVDIFRKVDLFPMASDFYSRLSSYEINGVINERLSVGRIVKPVGVFDLNRKVKEWNEKSRRIMAIRMLSHQGVQGPWTTNQLNADIFARKLDATKVRDVVQRIEGELLEAVR